MSPKKIALWFLIISVAISATLGVIAIISGTFGDFEIRVILTTVTISAASICALAAGALWESRKTRSLPVAGVVCAILAALLIIGGIWMEAFNKRYWQLTATVSVLAIATAQASLVSLARLTPRFVWARVGALIAISLLAALIIFVIHGEVDNDGIFRAIGALAIVVAALTIMMPIFHRLSRADLNADQKLVSISDDHLFPTVLCPRCGNTQNNSLYQITCTSCGCRFLITIIRDNVAPKRV